MNATHKSVSSASLVRLQRFWQKPWREKAESLKNRCARAISIIPKPMRLSFGSWWLARNDGLGEQLRFGGFEREELDFVRRFLQPGMTVLDIGAHHGLYTLLASKQVGSTGRVYSFEPSPRERKALSLHVGLNFCRNVSIERIALGGEEGTADLFVVQGSQTGCNSLRPPVVPSEMNPVKVDVLTLDTWLHNRRIAAVDFIKLDVEGAELEVLKGSARLLEMRPRPVILAEVQDVRTEPWGYKAKEILDHLHARCYEWFRLLPDGSLDELDLGASEFDGNFVACPEEAIEILKVFRSPATRNGGKLEINPGTGDH
jgi:FkbM family methyltransferase